MKDCDLVIFLMEVMLMMLVVMMVMMEVTMLMLVVMMCDVCETQAGPGGREREQQQ